VNPEEKNRASNASSPAEELNDLSEMRKLLRQSMPPLSPDQLEPRTDLWPQLRTRIEAERSTDRTAGSIHRESPRIRVTWFDWALAALAAAALIFYPGIIPALLYHF
jgi:hypothetical protein